MGSIKDKLRHPFRRAAKSGEGITEEQKKSLLSSTALTTNAQSMRAAWKLIKPYWTSEDKWKGRALLASIIGLSLGQVGMGVLFNQWNNAFYDAIQNYNAAEFTKQLGVFSALAFTSIAAGVYQTYLTQALQMRWRKWTTDQYLNKWMGNKAFYHLQNQSASGEGAGKATDNPDQRIADDLSQFTGSTLGLGVGFLSNTVNLAAFTNILWNLPGSTINFNMAGHQFNDFHYLVWGALAYSAVGTFLTHKIGRKMVELGYNQQKYEADLRYSMVRVRENAESIAMSGGEEVEKATIKGRFNRVVGNWWDIMKKQKQLSAFQSGFAQTAIIFPYLTAAPIYFAKTINLGTFFRIADAFRTVQGSMSWFVDAYNSLASWRATTNRLTEFTAAIEQVKADENAATMTAAAVGAPIISGEDPEKPKLPPSTPTPITGSGPRPSGP